MPQVNAPSPGHFVWIELATSDPVAAKSFYASLFGWTANETDIGEFGTYTIFQKEGRDAAAMYGLMPDQKEQGVPPNWLTYVGVESADEKAAQARSLGAAILQPPFDVFDFGRMAVLRDPQGAVFALWQAKKHWGVTIRDEANTLCWNELATNDREASRRFYAQLFGWEEKVSPDYIEWSVAGTAIGGMRSLGEGEPAPPNWMPYFLVDDVEASTARAQSAGGAVHVPPSDIPDVGRFSVIGDPQGAVFALFKLAAHHS